MIMIRVLWSRFQQYLGKFSRLLVEASSETGLFRLLRDYVFGLRNLENTKSMTVIFLVKYFKISFRFEKCSKKVRNTFFCFWDDCIWICIVKLSLLRTGYFSSATNVLTSSPKILHVNKRDFFQLNWIGSGQRVG